MLDKIEESANACYGHVETVTMRQKSTDEAEMKSLRRRLHEKSEKLATSEGTCRQLSIKVAELTRMAGSLTVSATADERRATAAVDPIIAAIRAAGVEGPAARELLKQVLQVFFGVSQIDRLVQSAALEVAATEAGSAAPSSSSSEG